MKKDCKYKPKGSDLLASFEVLFQHPKSLFAPYMIEKCVVYCLYNKLIFNVVD